MQLNLKKISVLIPVVMVPLGLWLGYRTFRDHSVSEILGFISAIPTSHLALACASTAASYLCLTCFDALAVRYVGHKLPYDKVALTSFVSLSIGHTVGVAVLSSGTLRYRFYSGFGLSAVEVGKVILFCGVTVALGLMTLAGGALLLRPDISLGPVGLTPIAARAIGILFIALAALYIFLAWRWQKPIHIRGHELRLPAVRIAAAQLAIGVVNFAFVAATLHQLLQGAAPYTETAAAYVVGNISGLISHVPGGLGVLEFVVSSLVSQGQVIGALIAFRIIYYFIPLVLGVTLLIGTELTRLGRRKS